jgi:type VI secretion system protein ImpA
MKIEALAEPVSDDLPCGPDLNADVDPHYDEYYFGALGRLPGFYFQPGVERPDGTRSPDRLFDASSVDHATEAKAIDALLERSRDIRLLVLRAQWEALAGRAAPMAEAVEGIATVLETFGDAAHPSAEGGPSERRDAIGDLNQQITMILPLQFMGLTGSSEVTLRKIRVSNGQGTPLSDEEDLQPGLLMDALADGGNRKRVDDVHAALLRMSDGLARIESACQKSAAAPFSPSLDLVKQTVAEMLDAITSARPDLRGADVQSTAPIEDDVPQDESSDQPDGSEAVAAPVAAAAPSDVKNHAHARQILEACEHYYRRMEPSSAALLLVTQARLLIGKPLVEALETLLPGQSGRAIVDFGPQTGFALDSGRLKQLSGAAPEGPAPTGLPEPESAPPTVVSTAGEAAGAMRSVEDYFRKAERSSPVPILLQRARSYLDKDFQSLIDELIPKSTEG